MAETTRALPALSDADLLLLRAALIAAVAQGDDAKRDLWRVYQSEFRRRRDLARADEDDPAVRARLVDLCRPTYRDLPSMVAAFLFFVRTFGVVVEPRDAGSGDVEEATTVIPFVPMPHQEDIVWEVLEAYLAQDADGRPQRRTIFVEKARDIGATWILLALVVWLWLYEKGFSWHFGSRNDDLVDKNPGSRDEDTLLGRIELIVDALPPYLRPLGFDLMDKEKRQKHLWINPENGNRLTGETANPNFGRQQRKTGLLFDELAFAEHQQAIIRGTADLCRVRVVVTTPDPDAEACKELMRRPGVRVLSHHWSVHPEKTVAWYEEQRLDRSEEEIANELDLSWEGGSERRIYPEWDAVTRGVFGFRPGHYLWGGVDFGRSDPTGLIIGQEDPATGRVRILLSYLRAGEQIDFFLPFFGTPATSGLHTYGAHEIAIFNRIREWAKLSGGITWFGDPAGAQLTQAANQSVLDILTSKGVTIYTDPRIVNHDERQTRCKLLLRNCDVNIGDCRQLDLGMRNYRRPARRDSVGYQKKALHAHSHLPTALEYVAVNRHLLSGTRRPVKALPRHTAAYEEVA